MNYWHDISAGDDAPQAVNVVVEIPKGSVNKYEYDEKQNIFALDRVLRSSVHFPGDYGFIPQTLGEDGDPLDALILVSFPTYPGVLVTARPIGVLKMQDGGEGDDKILCVPMQDERMKDTMDVKDLQNAAREEVAHFFEVYKQLEGKKIVLGGWHHVDAAHTIIEAAMARYKEKFPASA